MISLNRFILLVASTCLLAVAPAAAEPAEPAERTRELVERRGETRTPEQTAAYCAEVAAWSDTLAATGRPGEAADCLHQAGIAAYLAGDFTLALELWDRGLALAHESGDPARIGALLNARASGVSAAGDNERACTLFRELVDYRRSHGDERGAGVALSNLAFSQVALFRYPEAIATLREAVATHRAVGNRRGLAHSRITLSELLAHAGSHDEALAAADSAVADARAGESPQQLAPALHVRALRRVNAGLHAQALADFDESLTLQRSAGLATMEGPTRINRADLLVTMGRADEAAAEARAALDQVGMAVNPAQAITARGTLGRALIHTGDLVSARRILADGIAGFFALQDSLAGAVQRADANVVATPLSVMSLLQLQTGDAEGAWATVESGLARQLRRSLLGPDTVVSLEAFQQRLAMLRARALVVGIASSEGCPVLLVTPHGVTGGNLALHTDAGRDLERVNALIAGDAAPDLLLPPLTRLAARLADAVPDLFTGDSERLVIMPGGLDGFPFEVLPDPDGETLGDRFIVSYAPCATVFAELEERSTAASEFLALADPAPAEAAPPPGATLAMRAASARPPLPQARAEAAAVAPPGGRVLTGAAATPCALIEHGARAAVLHLATHASVDRQHPDASSLLLAPDADHAHGTLTAADIAGLGLPADLVSLSGCRTVGGYRVMGEGTFGLVRSFLQAGSRTVVASRWDVEDTAARRFMELFYEALTHGEDRDRALTTARRAMRDEGYGPRDHAAFALVGAVSGGIPVLQSGGPVPRGPLLPVAILAAAAVVILLVRRRAT